jgi:hypothetical protein
MFEGGHAAVRPEIFLPTGIDVRRSAQRSKA